MLSSYPFIGLLNVAVRGFYCFDIVFFFMYIYKLLVPCPLLLFTIVSLGLPFMLIYI